jgi:hypothetical protein
MRPSIPIKEAGIREQFLKPGGPLVVIRGKRRENRTPGATTSRRRLTQGRAVGLREGSGGDGAFRITVALSGSIGWPGTDFRHLLWPLPSLPAESGPPSGRASHRPAYRGEAAPRWRGEHRGGAAVSRSQVAGCHDNLPSAAGRARGPELETGGRGNRGVAMSEEKLERILDRILAALEDDRASETEDPEQHARRY